MISTKSLEFSKLKHCSKINPPSASRIYYTKLFSFSDFCTGMRISDLLMLKWENIQNNNFFHAFKILFLIKIL
jgi:integrase